jgi:hypothetical protein
MQYACIVTTRVDWLPIAMLPPLVRIGYDDVRRKTSNNTVMVGGPSVLCYTMYVTTTILLLPRALHLQQSLCCGLRRPRESWGGGKRPRALSIHTLRAFAAIYKLIAESRGAFQHSLTTYSTCDTTIHRRWP